MQALLRVRICIIRGIFPCAIFFMLDILKTDLDSRKKGAPTHGCPHKQNKQTLIIKMSVPVLFR